jgi:4-hydroxy-3-polyprenylbenzoate decarboxylase
MKKIAVGITGASGAIYARSLLQQLQLHQSKIAEIGVVWSDNAKTVWKEELQDETYNDFPFTTWHIKDYYAPFASGSAGYDSLIICPCSMGTLGRIAHGISDNLITRAADVMLKERKKLICVARETPFNLIHINNMKAITEAGGIICPASPSFYSKPQTIEEAALTVVHRVLQLAGIATKGFQWGNTK